MSSSAAPSRRTFNSIFARSIHGTWRGPVAAIAAVPPVGGPLGGGDAPTGPRLGDRGERTVEHAVALRIGQQPTDERGDMLGVDVQHRRVRPSDRRSAQTRWRAAAARARCRLRPSGRRSRRRAPSSARQRRGCDRGRVRCGWQAGQPGPGRGAATSSSGPTSTRRRARRGSSLSSAQPSNDGPVASRVSSAAIDRRRLAVRST